MKLEDYQKKYKNTKKEWTLKRFQAFEEFCKTDPAPLRFKKEYGLWYGRLAAYMEERGFKE